MTWSKIKCRLLEIEGMLETGNRITPDDALFLYENASLGFLGMLADIAREKASGNCVYYNRNLHLEPTNICIYGCRFCAYSKKAGENGAWDMSSVELMDYLEKRMLPGTTELHIVGGVYPGRDVFYYAKQLSMIRRKYPDLHIKAFTAIELDYMFKTAGVTIEDGLDILIEGGLNSIPGGGAEIFDDEIRKKICHEKSDSATWLKIHKAVHKKGLPSNATMLYGHIESIYHRIRHLEILRNLQDETGGFNSFIPLKYRSGNNRMEKIGEVTFIEDLRNFSLSRIFLDNFRHIKAYWPMAGKNLAQLSLSFGVNDLDGTVNDSTKIYSMAGAEEKNPSMTSDEIIRLIEDTGKTAVERDSYYNAVKR
ncbi:MAG: CofH family radical SAM protein [Bacteroidota bacterium]